MKISVMLTVLALTCGSALAQAGSGSDRDHKAGDKPSAAAADDVRGEGIGVKTKRAIKRMGDKMRSAGNQLARKAGDRDQAAGRSDTRAMGAGSASDSADGARRARMDQAYDNWKSGKK